MKTVVDKIGLTQKGKHGINSIDCSTDCLKNTKFQLVLFFQICIYSV